MKLIEDIGFEPYDNGNLDNSWSQQPNSAGYCCYYTCEELKQVKEKSKQTKESVKKKKKKVLKKVLKKIEKKYLEALPN